MTPISLGIFASANTTTKLSYESIAVSSVGSGGASSVTFSSIPSTYTHLQLRTMVRSTSNSGFTNGSTKLTFNADTSTTYPWHQLEGDGSSANATAVTNTSWIATDQLTSNLAASNIFGVSVIDILDYKNTNKYKTVRTLTGFDLNGSGSVFLRSGLWQSTNAITSITLETNATGNFAQYSHFALYGIKAA